MSIDEIVDLAAEAKAAALITRIEAGELTYEAAMTGLHSGGGAV